MRLLLDENLPKRLKSDFPDHEVFTVREKVWNGIKNGEILLKNVLPALVPELSLESLDISNGGDASAAFYNLTDETDIEKIADARNALLEYCGMDTMAMVKILEKLMEVRN